MTVGRNGCAALATLHGQLGGGIYLGRINETCLDEDRFPAAPTSAYSQTVIIIAGSIAAQARLDIPEGGAARTATQSWWAGSP